MSKYLPNTKIDTIHSAYIISVQKITNYKLNIVRNSIKILKNNLATTRTKYRLTYS